MQGGCKDLASRAAGTFRYPAFSSPVSTECAAMFRKLHEEDARQVEEIRDHLMKMMSKHQGK